jgi:PAS domain S-box-containing protein
VKRKSTPEDTGLRGRAEERLRERKRETGPSPTKEDTRRMVHELEVHQIQLEMQNEELKQARKALERQLEKYSDLYSFAPVGYFTLDNAGTIREANLFGARLLGIERSRLVGRRMGSFLCDESHHSFTECLTEIYEGIVGPSCELALLAPGSGPRYVQIEGTPVASDEGAAGQCRVVMIDITERKRAEDGLRESENTLKMALASSHMGVWQWHAATDEVFWSPECYVIMGSKDMSGTFQSFTSLLHPEDAPRVMAAIGQVSMDRPFFSAEFRIIRSEGGVRWLTNTGRGFFDGAGKLLRMIGTVLDITERKRTEEAVRESAQRVVDILESIGDAFFSLDENVVFTYFNAAAERLLGRARQDILGKPFEEAFPEAKGSLFHLNCARAIRERIPMSFEACFELPPYENWYDVRVYPRGKGISVFSQVVTERKRAESRSRKEMEYKDFLLGLNEKSPGLSDKELYDYALDNTVRLTDSAIGFFHLVTDDQKNVVLTTWNREALKNCNVPHETHYALEQAGNWVDCVRLKRPVIYNDFPHSPNQRGLPEGHVPVRRILSVPVMEGEKVRVIFGVGNKDQEYDEFDVTQIQLVATTLHAIMKQRQAEEALGSARDGLELRVQERTAELSKAYEALRRATEEHRQAEEQLRQAQKMEAVGTLAGGIAHDFNNILAAIIGFSEMARDKTPEGSPARSLMERVFAAGIRGRGLVKQILTFSRRAEQEKQRLKLAPMVRETLKLLRASLPATIDIRTDLQRESGFVLADRTQMQQVLMNLCTNAAHAMGRRGGSISIDLTGFSFSSPEDAPDPTMSPGLYTRLSVTDTGVGMSSETIEHIFDPFFTTKPTGEGTGLGLSVVHGIVASHGGTITVSSEQGFGSTFTVYLPKLLEEQAGDSGDGGRSIARGHERILFIDDEKDLAAMGDEMLTGLGYRVTSKTGAREALALFRLDPYAFDLVITDQTMPEMTGVELAQEILAARADLPIIMCTGFSHLVDNETARAAGVTAFAMKPLTKKEMAMTIRTVLDE